jgi:hypothetical protein
MATVARLNPYKYTLFLSKDRNYNVWWSTRTNKKRHLHKRYLVQCSVTIALHHTHTTTYSKLARPLEFTWAGGSCSPDVCGACCPVFLQPFWLQRGCVLLHGSRHHSPSTHRPRLGGRARGGPAEGHGGSDDPKIAGAEKLHLSAPGWIAPARWRRRT